MLRILRDPTFHATLCAIDFELAEATRSAGCPHCGEVLHSARYPRKPRCVMDLPTETQWRWSFCCAREGCRRRTTPPSVRFLGRRVWPAAVVLVLSVLHRRSEPRRSEKIRSAMGLARRTVGRWCHWWREQFPREDLWRFERARFGPPPPRDEELPVKLLRHFGRLCVIDTVVATLRFLAPLSTSSKILAF